MAQLVKAKRAENIPVLSGRLVLIYKIVSDQEVEVIEGTKVALQQKCAQSFEQLCRLEEARYQILRDLEHKEEALDIDNEQANLTQESSEICFQPNPTRVDKGYYTLLTTHTYAHHNLKLGSM